MISLVERDGYFQKWGLLGGSRSLEVCSWGWILFCSPSSSLCLDCHEVSAVSTGHTFPIMKFSLATGLEKMEPASWPWIGAMRQNKNFPQTFATIIICFYNGMPRVCTRTVETPQPQRSLGDATC